MDNLQTSGLHEAATFQVDNRVRTCAKLLEDTELLGKLSAGNLSLRNEVFTSVAVDNVDHNPTSSTSKDSFHGTTISLVQHPTHNGAGVGRSISIAEGSVGGHSQAVDNLPHFYTDVPPVNSSISIKNSLVPATSVTPLKRDGFKQQAQND